MNYLGPVTLLTILLLHHAYAQYNAKLDLQDANLPLVLYNPLTGEQVEPRQFLSTINLRSARQNINDNVIELPTMGRPCSCQDYGCKCCLGMGLGPLKQGLCTMIQYDSRNLGVHFLVEMNGNSVASFGISANDMPDICTPLILPIPIFGCLRISNIQRVPRGLRFCVSLVLKLVFYQLFEYKFNCLQFGLRGVFIESDADADFHMIHPKFELNQQILLQPTNNKLDSY